MQRPLFLEGEAGVGKTEIAKVIAQALGRELIRLQCYEGLDIAQAAYEWNYSRQMIEIRLAEAAGEKSQGQARRRTSSRRNSSSSGRCCRRSKAARRAPVLLIDELDRTDEPFEAYLLEVLSDWQITIPEIGTLQGRRAAGRGDHLQPHARDPRRGEAALLLPLGRLSRRGARARDPAAQGAEGGRARCRARWWPSCSAAQDAISSSCPGVAETIDWANCLVALDRVALDPETVNNTLGVLLKYRDDLERVAGEEAARLVGRGEGRRGRGVNAASFLRRLLGGTTDGVDRQHAATWCRCATRCSPSAAKYASAALAREALAA